MKPYEYLLFDMDNTLLDFQRAEHDAMVDAMRYFHYPDDETMIWTYSRINDEHWKMLERGEIDSDTLLWHRFAVWAERYSLEPELFDPHAFSQKYMEYLATKSICMEGALEVCECLGKRYPLYLITNGPVEVQYGRFSSSPLYSLFQKCFISGEIGHSKPSQAFFDAVCREIPLLDPAHTLVIGDSLTSDIAGGIRWGTDTCWLSSAGSDSICSMHMVRPTYTISHLQDLLDILL